MTGLFGAGGPVLGLPDRFDEPEPAHPAVGEPSPPPPSAEGVTSTNRSGTVSVTATSTGQPVDVRIDPRELRYSGGELASAILELCRRSTQEAKARRREELSAAGVRPDILDQLGLPARAGSSEGEVLGDTGEPAPPAWMRPV
ncbi:YbaB/EbfC family nucleoid-associated protein [Rhodococcus triatomae]